MFWVKLKAGALQLTLFVVVVIALLLAAFILLVHTHKQFSIQTDFIIDTVKNTNKGIHHALINSVPLKDTTTIHLQEEDYKILKVHREFWGVFEKVTTVSTIKNNTLKKTALVGATQAETNRTALYVQENKKPLVLVGNTKIQGLAYVPQQGVKPGTIAGQSYYGSQLIYGPKRASSGLPKIFTETINQINALENSILRASEEHLLQIQGGNSYSHSFLKPTQRVFSNTDIQLNTIGLTGNIIVQSNTKIVVKASSKLKDVLLIAPEIEIQDHVKGNFQAIASKKIWVGNNVQLEYPSALVLNEKKKGTQQEVTNNGLEEQNSVVINNNSTIKGLLLYLGQDKQNNYKAQIELKEQAVIIGELYCNQNTELKGTVYGTVYTSNFIAKQSGSIYQNHIYNGTIRVDELPQEYVGLTFNNSKKGVIKWLY